VEVLLLKDIKRLGKAGEVRKVADGYARNYLIPRGLAVPATPGAIKRTEVQKAIEEQREERLRSDATALAEHMSSVTLTFKVKAGEKGRLYGSVTAADIAAELEKKTGYAVDKRKVGLDEPLRLLGSHKVPLKLVAGVASEMTVVIEEAPEAESK
jgi:large subunit ribosomal protein L9